ncbi:hypothetical protein [Leptospira sp. GIMC2001]|uniref:hypothetical protein n=1 Tax=Leptospira sp. GIMC2001 TaxID=1513297 RepID=UPI002349F861|nr:hypothetical protein [Leptospira sp. GIMC2001]WCL50768.1 hypothetical protein O4O04_08130 [Leptospira sp. GIMC2001]
MNVKLKYFHDNYNSRNDSEINELRCYMLFERAGNDLKNECLNLLPRHEKLKFLEIWAIGLTVSENDFDQISKELEEIFTLKTEVGGKVKAEKFIQSNPDSEYITSLRNLLDVTPSNDPGNIFATTQYYTAKDIYSIIKSEDPLVISIALDNMEKCSTSLTKSKEIRAMFDELPIPQPEVYYSTVREIERVLERKLSRLEEG